MKPPVGVCQPRPRALTIPIVARTLCPGRPKASARFPTLSWSASIQTGTVRPDAWARSTLEPAFSTVLASASDRLVNNSAMGLTSKVITKSEFESLTLHLACHYCTNEDRGGHEPFGQYETWKNG